MQRNEKNLKTNFRHNFSPKRDEIGQESRKKILVPNSVHTRPGQENSEKNSKKIRKIKNLFPALFLAQTGWDRPRKRKKKNLDPNFVPTEPKLENSRKNSKKIQKIKKVNSSIISIQNGLGEAEKAGKKF